MKKILILLNLSIIMYSSGCSMNANTVNNNTSQIKSTSPIINDDVLGSDLFSRKFELEETIYSIPVVLGDLEKKGWKLQVDSLKALKSGEKNSLVVLENNGKTICVSIENKHLRDMYIEDCIVNGILIQKSNDLQAKINLPGNITIGSTNKEVESAFKDIISNDDIRQSDDVINYACCKDGFSVSIIVDKTTDKVFCISLSEI